MESNFPRNDNSVFVALSKDPKVGIHNVYLAAFEYFLPGIMHFDRPIRIKHFMPCARVVDKTALGTRFGHVIMFFGCAALHPVECTFNTMGIS